MGKRERYKRWDIADINLQKRVELGTILSLLQTKIDYYDRWHDELQKSGYALYRGNLQWQIAGILANIQEDLLKLTGEL